MLNAINQIPAIHELVDYQEGPDEYPRMLWNEIRKSITG